MTVAEGLTDPWAIAVLPDGDMLITEKAGALRLVRGGQAPGRAGAGCPDVRVGGQGGLMDIVLAPDFASSRRVYMTIAKSNADDSLDTTALVRARFDGMRLTDLEEIIETRAWAEARAHYGTRATFDDKGHVFLTLADRSEFYKTGRDLPEHPAQRLDNHMGKVLRLNVDGSVPADNPFAGREGALPEIWTLGHRDPQGIAFRPETGAVWLVEHGPLDGDEVVEVATVVDGLGRIRDVHEGPDGLVYLAITAGEGAQSPILRLEPAD